MKPNQWTKDKLINTPVRVKTPCRQSTVEFSSEVRITTCLDLDFDFTTSTRAHSELSEKNKLLNDTIQDTPKIYSIQEDTIDDYPWFLYLHTNIRLEMNLVAIGLKFIWPDKNVCTVNKLYTNALWSLCDLNYVIEGAMYTYWRPFTYFTLGVTWAEAVWLKYWLHVWWGSWSATTCLTERDFFFFANSHKSGCRKAYVHIIAMIPVTNIKTCDNRRKIHERKFQ